MSKPDIAIERNDLNSKNISLLKGTNTYCIIGSFDSLTTKYIENKLNA